MSKFKQYKNIQQSTNPGSKSPSATPKASREKYISPFPFSRCPSPLKVRLDNSPLHVPLAIALKKLVSADHTEARTIKDVTFSTDLENIKNVLQQFAQSLYLTLERELYSKFNVEMKRIVLRSREVEKLLAKVQQKIIINADIIEAEHVYKAQRIIEQRKIDELSENNRELSNQLSKANQQIKNLILDKQKMENENTKLMATIEKLQSIMLRKMQEKQNNQNICNMQPHHAKNSFASQPSRPQFNRFSEEMPSYWQQSYQMGNSILNINQILPSHSPVQKQKTIKLKPTGKPMSFVNFKNYDN